MSSLDICQPQTWGIKILKLWVSFRGCSTWISTRSCGMKEQSVQYTSHFSIHSMQAMAICSRNGSSCLNCGISRVLESWPFRCALSMRLCMVALWLFNKDVVCWHILLTSVTYLPLQRRCVECSRFLISLSLNDSAHNILKDVLKIYGLVGSLLFNSFSVLDGFLVSVILSSVISPTGGMVMCFSSSQVSILHLQKDGWSCFLVTASLTESSAVFVIHLTNVFNMLFLCDSSLFTHTKICHWATASIVVSDGFAVLAFLRSLRLSLLIGSFVSKFCSRS